MLERLRNLVLEALPEEGRIENPMPCLALTRFNGPQQSRQCFYHPMMTLGLGGEKESLIGGRPVVYGAGEAVVVALDLPGAYQIRNASPEQPFLSLSIRLDRAIITELLTETPELRPAPNGRDAQESVSVEHLPDEILNALVRYLEAMHSPRRAAVLGPMILKEIHYLLLEGPQGRVLADVCSEAAPGSRILTAVRWLREHFDEPLDIATISERTAMAPSTFHRQFRAVTSLSPVQYQKRLRLHEAQRLMLVESLGVEAAARRVGYESCSQFSREYKLENPVLREIAADRGATVAQVALAWLAERGIISISKTVSPARMAENLAASNVKLTPEDMAKIATLDTGTSRFFSHRDPKIVEWLCTRRLPSEP